MKIFPLPAGSAITESWVSGLVEQVNALGGDANGTYTPFGNDAAVTARMRGGRRPTISRIAIARMKRDIVPVTNQESNWTDFPESGDGVADSNAVLQVWSDEDGDWIDDDNRDVTVVAMHDLPIRAGDAIMVGLDHQSGYWFPTETPLSAIVEIVDSTPDADGFMDAVIKLWDSNNKVFYEGAQIWALDVNRS